MSALNSENTKSFGSLFNTILNDEEFRKRYDGKYDRRPDFIKDKALEQENIRRAVANLDIERAKMEADKAMSNAPKNNIKEPIYYILVTAGAMVVAYILYNKFKK